MTAQITVIPTEDVIALFTQQLTSHTLAGNSHVIRVLEYLCSQLGIEIAKADIADHLPGDWSLEQYRYASKRAESQRHRASGKYGLTDHFDAIDLLELGDKLFWRCCACGGHWHFYDDLTVDHITPLSAGGTNTIDNIQLICDLCHREKEKIYHETGIVIDYRARLPYWKM